MKNGRMPNTANSPVLIRRKIMVSVTFKVGGTDVVLHASEGDNLLAAAQRANVAIDAPCSGNGACGKCKVKLVSGELDSPQTRHISDE